VENDLNNKTKLYCKSTELFEWYKHIVTVKNDNRLNLFLAMLADAQLCIPDDAGTESIVNANQYYDRLRQFGFHGNISEIGVFYNQNQSDEINVLVSLNPSATKLRLIKYKQCDQKIIGKYSAQTPLITKIVDFKCDQDTILANLGTLIISKSTDIPCKEILGLKVLCYEDIVEDKRKLDLINNNNLDNLKKYLASNQPYIRKLHLSFLSELINRNPELLNLHSAIVTWIKNENNLALSPVTTCFEEQIIEKAIAHYPLKGDSNIYGYLEYLDNFMITELDAKKVLINSILYLENIDELQNNKINYKQLAHKLNDPILTKRYKILSNFILIAFNDILEKYEIKTIKDALNHIDTVRQVIKTKRLDNDINLVYQLGLKLPQEDVFDVFSNYLYVYLSIYNDFYPSSIDILDINNFNNDNTLYAYIKADPVLYFASTELIKSSTLMDTSKMNNESSGDLRFMVSHALVKYVDIKKAFVQGYEKARLNQTNSLYSFLYPNNFEINKYEIKANTSQDTLAKINLYNLFVIIERKN
jgi:hypothetical protein